MVFISVTRLRLRSWRFVPAFLWHAVRSNRQARLARGNLGMSLLNDARLVFWTKTAWTDEAAMKAFMVSGAHKAAMPALLHICDEASVVHWIQETADLPSWADAYERMRSGGRASKVRHPSPDHVARHIPPPRRR